MKRYLIQVRNCRSADSSHRVPRWTVEANNLEDLISKLHCDQHEIEVLASEEMSQCDMGIHAYQVMYNQGKCTLCGHVYKREQD